MPSWIECGLAEVLNARIHFVPLPDHISTRLSQVGLFSGITDTGSSKTSCFLSTQRGRLDSRWQPDERRLKTYMDLLKAAGGERAAFDRVVCDLWADQSVSAVELRAIAQGYVGEGRQPATRKAALAALSTRFAKLVRARKNRATGEKVRVF